MAVAILVAVFIGFAPTYYFRGRFHDAPLPVLVQAHGAVFTAWVLLFCGQALLVGAGRVSLHRRLGLLGAALAPLVVLLGLATALLSVRRDLAAGHGGALSFLALPIGDMALFGGLAAAGLLLRRRPEAHKRLMLLATVALLSAAFARWPAALRLGGPLAFGGIDVFLVANLVHDLVVRKRVHPVSLWGGLIVAAVERLRLLVSHTTLWLELARWIAR
jgi:hypothetical protein